MTSHTVFRKLVICKGLGSQRRLTPLSTSSFPPLTPTTLRPQKYRNKAQKVTRSFISNQHYCNPCMFLAKGTSRTCTDSSGSRDDEASAAGYPYIRAQPWHIHIFFFSSTVRLRRRLEKVYLAGLFWIT